MKPRDVALLVLIQIIWGSVYPLCKAAMADLPPVLLVAILYGISAVALWPFATRMRTPQWRLAVLAFFGCTIQTSITFIGYDHAPASLGILLMQLQVPFGVGLAWALGRGRPDSRSIAGVTVALAGAAIVIGWPKTEGETWGIWLILLGACLWSGMQAVMPLVARDDGVRLHVGLCRHAAPQVLIATLLLESGQMEAMRNASAETWVIIALVSIFGSALGYAIWYKLLMRIPADRIFPFLLLMPPTGVVVSHLKLDEPLSFEFLVGAVVIMLGLAIIAWPKSAVKETAAAPGE